MNRAPKVKVYLVLALRITIQQTIEQRYVIKFCVKLNKFTTETFDINSEVYMNKAMSKICFFSGIENSKIQDDIEDKLITYLYAKDVAIRSLYLMDGIYYR